MSDKYFNLTSRGFGYMSNIRVVQPRNGGDSYTRVDVRAMYGKAANGDQDQGKIRYTTFDLIVPTGSEVSKILTERIVDATNDKDRKVLASFVAGDLFPTSNTGKDGKVYNKITGRLLSLTYVKIDGEIVHSSAEANEDGVSPAETQNQENAAPQA